MATISPTQGSSGAQQDNSSSTTKPRTSDLASENTFLTLLVSQLKNQDPLNPADSTQFVGQLAQFSSLEQLIQLNKGMGSLTSTVATSSTPATASLNISTTQTDNQTGN